MKLGVYKRIGNAIRVGGSQLMRKVSIELERDKKMCSETLSSIWSGNAPLQEQLKSWNRCREVGSHITSLSTAWTASKAA